MALLSKIGFSPQRRRGHRVVIDIWYNKVYYEYVYKSALGGALCVLLE